MSSVALAQALLFLLLGLAAAWFVGRRVARSLRHEAIATAVLKQLKFQRVTASDWPQRGRVNDVWIEVKRHLIPRGEGRHEVHLRCACEGDLGLDLQLSAASLLDGVTTVDRRVGEPDFDARVCVVTGAPLRALGLLGADVRRATVAAVELGGSFDGKRWRVDLADNDAARISEKLHAIGAAQGAFEKAVAAEESISKALERERHAGVRLNLLERALSEPDTDHEVALGRLADLDPAVRLRAAESLGAAGVDTLLDLVRTASRSWRTRASAQLLLGGFANGSARTEAEQTLLTALDDPSLATEVIQALGMCGTARAVLPLEEVGRTGSTVAIRSAARVALARVRTRLDPAAAGQLAIVGVEDGGSLAVAADPGGALAEPPTVGQRPRTPNAE